MVVKYWNIFIDAIDLEGKYNESERHFIEWSQPFPIDFKNAIHRKITFLGFNPLREIEKEVYTLYFTDLAARENIQEFRNSEYKELDLTSYMIGNNGFYQNPKTFEIPNNIDNLDITIYVDEPIALNSYIIETILEYEF